MLHTLETWAQRVWAERDETAIDEIRVADARSHGLGQQSLESNDSFKQFHRSLCKLLTDTSLTFDHHVEGDGWVAALCTFSGTTASGQRVAMKGAIHARVANGKILEAYNNFDFLGLFMKMGLLPPDTFQRCLNGQPVGGS